MKRILLISLVLFAACRPASTIPDPDPEDPGTIFPPGTETVSIAYLKTLWKGAPVKITEEIRISGYVVSSDVMGNFYKTLVLDDGTAGIELKLDMEGIFRRFIIHTPVDVRCNGLWLGSYGGTLQLGAEPYGDWQAQHIPEGDIPLHCQSEGLQHVEVLPRRLTLQSIAPQHISAFVSFEGLQFITEEMGLGWAAKDANTDRHLIDATRDTLIVRTSRYALFGHKVLPKGNGYIEGVLNYFNGTYQLVVCDDQKAIMESQRW